MLILRLKGLKVSCSTGILLFFVCLFVCLSVFKTVLKLRLGTLCGLCDESSISWS